MAASASAVPSLVTRRLYRSLLKAAKPFAPSSPKAPVLTCLLHRTGLDDTEGGGWAAFLRAQMKAEGDTDDEEEDVNAHHTLFQKLLREVITGNASSGIRQMQFPCNVNTARLQRVIRREFRNNNSISKTYSEATRRHVGFLALRELNKKVIWANKLEKSSAALEVPHHPQQAARDVSPLPLYPPSSYLRPGAYLIAHPLLTGYFRRAVICILDHKEEGDAGTASYGTYGLVINRVCSSPSTGKNLTLEEIVRPLPSELSGAFGGSLVKEGGPVHMSLQMLHSLATPEQQEELKIGGHPLSMIVPEQEQDKSTALYSDRAIYYKGDIVNAANAVMSGRLDRQDASFFVGASSWAIGQLESEMERGCWLPCRGPPDIAHSGICEHDEATAKGKPRPKADLWLSMLSACGDDEAALAHLMWPDDGQDELGAPCDDFTS